jgi:hypothetical protein
VAACARNDVSPVFAAAFSTVEPTSDRSAQKRLRREKLEAAKPFQIVAREFQRAQRTPFFECRLAAVNEIALPFLFCRPALLQILVDALEPPLGNAEIREDQFVLHGLRVACGVDRA